MCGETVASLDLSEHEDCMCVGTLLKHAVSLLLFMPISLPYIILCFSWCQIYVKAKE